MTTKQQYRDNLRSLNEFNIQVLQRLREEQERQNEPLETMNEKLKEIDSAIDESLKRQKTGKFLIPEEL